MSICEEMCCLDPHGFRYEMLAIAANASFVVYGRCWWLVPPSTLLPAVPGGVRSVDIMPSAAASPSRSESVPHLVFPIASWCFLLVSCMIEGVGASPEPTGRERPGIAR